jgi:DHA2 family multidrug resistance protein
MIYRCRKDRERQKSASFSTSRPNAGYRHCVRRKIQCAALTVVGALLGRRVDARWLIAAGLLILAAGNFWMSQLNLGISPWQAVWPRVVMILGLGMIFAPLNVAAYLYIPLALRGAAVGLFALLRNEGGSFGTSIGQTITERRE